MGSRSALPRLLSGRLPFFYGWVILGCLCCAGFSRQGPAVATLSIFVEPLTREFGWSRAALSGAVSLGGVLAAVTSPWIGPLVDRYGSRATLSVAVLATAAAVMLLSLTQSLFVFYLLFCIARMVWAGPFELAIYGAVNNWFVARRAFATSIATVAQMAGLVAMPLIAQLAMQQSGWRFGWLAIGSLTLVVGFLPVWLFMVRRPEDLGLLPDRAARSGDRRPSAAARRAEFLAPTSRRHCRILASAVVHRAGLPGTGRRQPAPGGASDRARHRADDRCDYRQHFFADLGGREHRLRVPAALLADPLSDGIHRRAPDPRRHC